MKMDWQYPEGGRFSVAVPGDGEIAPEVERFFGRELARYNHAVFLRASALHRVLLRR